MPARMDAGAAIEVQGLTKRYGSHVAVDGVSFEVRQGEAFGILGPNGAGKTTTLEMIEGLREPDAGEVAVLGSPVWPHPERIQARIGVQLQTTALFDRLSATELLVLFARFYNRSDADERAAYALELVGLEPKAGDYSTRMSGGQQQRLAIALALVHDPDVVFLDEPTTGLDPQARRNLWDVIRAINEDRGKTVVLTTHYLEEAEELCDRVAIMDEARIVAMDTPAGLIAQLDAEARVSYTDAEGEHTVYSKDTQAAVLELLEKARDRGSSIQNLSVRGPSLEDVFLQLTGHEFRE
jgi:ABC-2 type transport system ATP-binding protein